MDRSLQHTTERVCLERVAELEVLIEHGVALVPAELLEPGEMHAEVHAGGERAALEAVSAQSGAVEAGSGRAALDDAGYGAGVDRRGAHDEAGQGS